MKFPVWQTAAAVLRYCWHNRRLVMRFGAVPIILSVLIGAVGDTVARILDPNATVQQTESYAAEFVLIGTAIVQLLILLPLSVTLLRLAVLGKEDVRDRGIFIYGSIEWKSLAFQLRLVGLFILAVVAAGTVDALVIIYILPPNPDIVAAFSFVWIGFLLLLSTLFLARLCIVLVPSSLGIPSSFKEVWNLTRGTSWRLLGATTLLCIASAIPTLPLFLVGNVISAAAKSLALFLLSAGREVFGVFLLLTTATLFGFVYKMLTEHALQIETPPAGPPQAASMSTEP